METAITYGVDSMVAPLERVVMRRPSPSTFSADPDVWHYAAPLDPVRLARQYDGFTKCVAATGTTVHWIPQAEDGLADSIFAFDPSFMTPWGAILMRPGKTLRRPEVGLHRSLYRRLGIPIIGTVSAPATAEGGDLVWLGRRTLAVGRSFRTNQAGVAQLRDILEPYGVKLHAFDLPEWHGPAACLHLLSVVNPLDRDLALVHRPLLPVALGTVLRDRGIRCLEVDGDEFRSGGGMNLNVLVVAPRRCIAVRGFPRTLRLMRDAGCEVTVFAGDALCVPCEGGPTCMTLPIRRG